MFVLDGIMRMKKGRFSSLLYKAEDKKKLQTAETIRLSKYVMTDDPDRYNHHRISFNTDNELRIKSSLINSFLVTDLI